MHNTRFFLHRDKRKIVQRIKIRIISRTRFARHTRINKTIFQKRLNQSIIGFLSINRINKFLTAYASLSIGFTRLSFINVKPHFWSCAPLIGTSTECRHNTQRYNQKKNIFGQVHKICIQRKPTTIGAGFLFG